MFQPAPQSIKACIHTSEVYLLCVMHASVYTNTYFKIDLQLLVVNEIRFCKQFKAVFVLLLMPCTIAYFFSHMACKNDESEVIASTELNDGGQSNLLDACMHGANGKKRGGVSRENGHCSAKIN